MDTKIIETIELFKSFLEITGVRVNRIILFGSHVSGKLMNGSDIDVVVISEDFKTMNLLERQETFGLALAKAKIMEPIEAIGYTEEEYAAHHEGTFVGDEVKAKGIEVI
jgi:predicted nucleotidyltransferase